MKCQRLGSACRTLFVFAVLLTTASVPARADGFSICDSDPNNLVTNCGFETGTFANWTVTYAPVGSDLFVSGGVQNSGNYAAVFAADSAPDTIAQTLVTVPGDEYQFSFFLEGSNEVPNGSFQAYWNGVQVFDSSGLLSGDYEQYVFDVAAASSSTLIQFSGVNPPASYYLDDVQVDQLQSSSPEPASAVLAGLGLLICLARRSVFGGRWIGRKS